MLTENYVSNQDNYRSIFIVNVIGKLKTFFFGYYGSSCEMSAADF